MVPNSNDSRLEGTFDYSQSGIGRLGASMIFSAVMWLALIVFMFNGLLHVIHQPNSKGSIWPFALVLFLFFLIGIALLVAGISYLMAYRNERISIHGDEVQWTNRAGVVCLRFTLNQ